MSMEEPYSHISTPCAYDRVTGGNFCFIAQSFALSLLRQLCKSLRFIVSTVLDLRRLHRSESSSLDCLDSIRFLNLLAFVYKNLMSMGESHEHIRESTESLSASSLNPFHATFFINFL